MKQTEPEIQPRRGLRRSHYLGLLSVLVLAILAVSYLNSLFLYRTVRDQMDEQMGQRLLAIATTVARTLPEDHIFDLIAFGSTSDTYEAIRSELETIALDNQLDSIRLVDADRMTLLDPDPAGAATSAVQELQPELALTLETGQPQTSPLVRIDLDELPGEYLKTGFAPLQTEDGTVLGAVVVEGGSEFFSVLPGLRRRLINSAVFAGLALLVLGAVFFLILRSLFRLEDSLKSTAALAAIGQISSIVAHEIKNPLAIIRSRAERVRAKIEAGKDSEEVLEWFETIPNEVDRLNEIVTNYLSLARPGQGGEEQCEIASVARDTMALLRHDLERRGISLREDFPANALAAPTVQIGSRSLKQILLNLILNAGQAIEGEGQITVRSREVDRGWEISVIDTGRGMGEEEVRRILEPFYTTKETGSGLGLTLVQSLVTGRGGKLEIHSTPGSGTEIRIRLRRGETRAPLTQDQGPPRSA